MLILVHLGCPPSHPHHPSLAFVLQDTMESFFLSETVKYLYLLFSNASAVVDHFVLSTEVQLVGLGLLR